MLNDIQKMTIRVAVGKAADKNAEIKKLSVGFKVPESEIRTYWEGVSGGAPAATDHPKPAPTPKPQGSKKGRIFWTDGMIQQLNELNKLGNTAPQIAKVMGLEVKQVINKMQRLPSGQKIVPKASPAIKAHDPPDREPETPEPSESLEPETPVSEKSGSDILQEQSIACGPVDMTWAMLLMIKLVNDQMSEDVGLAYANNAEGRAECSFTVDGTQYDLTLGVAK
ncbi:hypothetical protein [Caproiciproducens sp.]